MLAETIAEQLHDILVPPYYYDLPGTTVPDETIRNRSLAQFGLRLPFTAEITSPFAGLRQAEEANKRGEGVVMLHNHYDKSNGKTLAALQFASRTLGRRPTGIVIAIHQHSQALAAFGAKLGIEFYPIATENTLRRGKYKHFSSRQGLADFFKNSTNLLSTGGVIQLAIHGERASSLDHQMKPAVSSFIRHTTGRKENFDRYGFLFVGLGERGKTDYDVSKYGGYRIGKIAQVKIGQYMTVRDILNHPDVSGDTGKIDSFIREQFRPITPWQYQLAPVFD